MYEPNVWVLTIFATILTTLCSLVGAFFVSNTCSKYVHSEIFLKNAVGFAVGVLLSTVFLHTIPEALHLFEHKEETYVISGIIFLSGVLCSILVEVIAHQHKHHLAQKHSSSAEQDILENKQEIESVAYNVIWGDAFHNFTDGIMIATSFTLCSTKLGWVVTLSVIIHELPHELTDLIVLIKSGMSIKRALIFNFLSSLTSIIAAIIVLSINEIPPNIQGYIIMFGSGSLTFISLCQLLPSISKDDHKEPTHLIFLILGMVLIGLLGLYHPECKY